MPPKPENFGALRRRDLQPCLLCDRGVAHDGGMMVYQITVQTFILDFRAIEQAHGLELVTGSPVLAAVMGPDRPLALAVQPVEHALLCQACALDYKAGIGPILSRLEARQDDHEAADEPEPDERSK